MSSAPTAIPPMTALSIAPNTRDITASGAIRCRIVYALTSTTEFASPSMIMTAAAAATLGHAATRSRGAAQKSTPMPKFRARRPRWASTSATNPPMNPPIPSVAFRKPRPELPSLSRPNAIATSKTSEAPATTVCAQ